MTRTTKRTWFRTSFEVLESREMMAADFSNIRLTSFLASASKVIKTTTTETQTVPAAPAPAPSVPVAPVTPTNPAAPVAPQQVDWFSANIVDVALRDLTRNSSLDGSLGRADMLAIFGQVQKDASVSANEFNDLKKLVSNNSLFGTNEYVRVLSTDVVLGNRANERYQGQVLGNLVAGSSASQLDKLVHKWFLGDDHPLAMTGTTYKTAASGLFPQAPRFTDIVQGVVGDCYFLSGLADAVDRNPSYITNMFVVNGDGTYTVRFYNNGKADYVTVDSMLPVSSRNTFVYANLGQDVSSKGNTLWVALAEKAYVQMNESGWLRANLGDTGGRNSYDAISGGYMTDALRQITNRNAAFANVDKNAFIAALYSGSMITFGSQTNPGDGVLGNHGYSLVAYNPATQMVTLFNPWGVSNRNAPALVTLNFAQLQADFATMQYTV